MCDELLTKGGNLSYTPTPDGKRVCGACKPKLVEPRKCDKCGKDTTGTGKMMVWPDGKKSCAGCAPTGPCGKCRQQVTFEHLTSGAIMVSDGTVCHKECWTRTTAKTGNLTKTQEKHEKVIVEDTCRACRKPICGKTVTAHMQDKFHEDCFKCARCGDLLRDSFVVNPDRKFKYQVARYLHVECAKIESQEAASGKAPVCIPVATAAADGAMRVILAGGAAVCDRRAAQGKPCAACGQSLSDGRTALKFVDGKVVHAECFKCSQCGVVMNPEDPSVRTLLRSKEQQCINGTLKCDACTPAGAPMPPPTVDLAQEKLNARTRHEELEIMRAAADRKHEEQKKKQEEHDAAAKAAAEEAEATKKAAAEAARVEAAAALAAHGAFTLEQLQDESYWKPKGVPAEQRETYLADAAFQDLFGMDKDAFEKLPQWKRTAAKKEHRLF
jgi:hypothetical protein